MTETDGQPTETEQASGNVVELPQRVADETSDGAIGFIREHPLLTVAGGIALGAVAASLVPKGTSRKLARRAIGLAEVAGSLGALLGTRVREHAGSARAELREQSGAMADRFEKLSESASERLSERLGGLSDVAGSRMEKLHDPIESAAGKVAKKASELRSRARR
jgi:hypothetical protein